MINLIFKDETKKKTSIKRINQIKQTWLELI
jgi:hypothetical protein